MGFPGSSEAVGDETGRTDVPEAEIEIFDEAEIDFSEDKRTVDGPQESPEKQWSRSKVLPDSSFNDH